MLELKATHGSPHLTVHDGDGPLYSIVASPVSSVYLYIGVRDCFHLSEALSPSPRSLERNQ
jgi:hypothetical protein